MKELCLFAVVSLHDPLTQCHYILRPTVCFVCVATLLLTGQVESTVLSVMHWVSWQHKHAQISLHTR